MKASTWIFQIMLAGFNPKDIIEIARSGLGFWEYQKRQETYNLKRKLEHYKKAFTDSQKRLQETTKDKDAQIEGKYLTSIIRS
jgi:hypothetical protein